MERHALCAFFLIVLLGSVCLQNGYASNEMENSTAVRSNEDRSSEINDVPKEPMGPDVFRQLLNQETLILMTLVKNVYSMMLEMKLLKNSVMSLQKNVEHVANVSMEDITGLKLANKKLKNSSEVLTEINQKQNKTISKLIHGFTDMKNEQNIDAKEMRDMDDQLLGNTSAALSELKANFHVLSLSLLTIDKQSQEFQKRVNEVDVSLPQTINETFNIVSESIKNISNQLSDLDDSLQTSRSELEESNQSYIKLSAAILSLEWFMSNISRKCDIQKRIGFTAGMNSTSSSLSSGKLVFNKVLFNQGNGYNLTSGVFTAPSSGIYVFYVSITSYDDNDIKVDITLNGTPLATAWGRGHRAMQGWFPGDYSRWQTGTNMAVSSLKVGDRVWVQYRSGNGYSSNSVPVTTFAGFVI